MAVTSNRGKQKEWLHAFFIKKENEEKFMVHIIGYTDDFRICHSLYCM